MKEKTFDQTIDDLSGSLQPVKPLSHPVVRILPWVLGTIVYTLIVFLVLGLRPDWTAKMQEPVFVFENALAVGIFITAAFASGFLCIPDMQGKNWVLAVPPSMLFVFCLWSLIQGTEQGIHVHDFLLPYCLLDAVAFTFVPAIFLGFLIHKGTTTRPLMMAFMNIMAIAAGGYVGLRFTCGHDSIGHAFILHLLPYILAGLVLGFVARRVYRF